jgi:MoxR-like ATPase
MSSSELTLETSGLHTLSQTKYLVSYILCSQILEQSTHETLSASRQESIKTKLAKEQLSPNESPVPILSFWDSHLNAYKKLVLNLEMHLVNFAKPLVPEDPAKKPQQERGIVCELLDHYKFVIVSGEPQSGKSHLIQEVTSRRNQSTVRIFITESLDTKSLLGNYVCSQKVGEFEWREGPLTAIVKSGGVLILENLQDAKDDLLNLLASLLDQTFSVRGIQIPAKDSFRMIASFTVGNPVLEAKLADVNRLSSEVMTHSKIPITYEEIFQNFTAIASNPLATSISHSLQQVFLRFSRDPKCEMKGTILDAQRFLLRFNSSYVGAFSESENPIHFSTEFKLVILQQFNEVYLMKFRQAIPQSVIVAVSEALGLSSGETASFLSSYHPRVSITESLVSTQRYSADRLEFRDLGSASQQSKTLPNIEYFSTSLVSSLLETVLGTMIFADNLLLVGEAGCGKTTVVQETATLLGKKLSVYNMSQSSDVADLIGGFRPLNSHSYVAEVAKEFVELIKKYFDYQKNIKLVSYLYNLLGNKKTAIALAYISREAKNIIQSCKSRSEEPTITEADKSTEVKRMKKMIEFETRVRVLVSMGPEQLETSLLFRFVPGSLVAALKDGDWVLLDEINLAQGEVLQSILPVLEKKSLLLIDKGEIKEVKRHKDFKLFGCMNPGTSVGKKELPITIRKNFLEVFVKELEDPNELAGIARNKTKAIFSEMDYKMIVDLYLGLRNLANQHKIADGFNRKPTISLRALSRAMEISSTSNSYYRGMKQRSILEGLFAGLSSNLNPESKSVFEALVHKIFNLEATPNQLLAKYENTCSSLAREGFINIEGFLIKLGRETPLLASTTGFLITGSIKKTLSELLRVISHSMHPVLLEGPTSAGKTSIIKYLGEVSGNKVVRINNHQHTDLEEYIGAYSPDHTGKLVFKEGLLVQAMRLGYWLILDELNLARSEILEALNRLLDDNRELFIPELNEVVKPAAGFRIFATQNPLDYAGRKELSVAFRSRFFHFFVRDIDDEDLSKIIEHRCKAPESRSKKLVDIMKGLRVLRSRQNIFSGKESLITVRDLMKWGSREITDFKQLAINGYCLLGERLRYDSERDQVRQVIMEKINKPDINFCPEEVYEEYYKDTTKCYESQIVDSVFWSKSFMRMYSLVSMALKQGEPVLLVGETGSGKTTVAELLAKMYNVKLYTVNCHQYTESSDFLGGLRPVRQKEGIMDSIRSAIPQLLEKFTLLISIESNTESILDSKLTLAKQYLIDLQNNLVSPQKLFFVESSISHLSRYTASHPDSPSASEQAKILEDLQQLKSQLERADQLFEYIDGPLLQAMTKGGVMLIDEISLAQDSVLERLNSVLEKEKTLTLSEKGDGSVTEITAHPAFMIIATMNPSGDYGKKELTPALRNRFTEIWVEPVTSPKMLEQDQAEIESAYGKPNIHELVPTLKNDFINFVYKELLRLEGDSNADPAIKHRVAVYALALYKLVSEFNKTFATLLKPLTVRDIKSTLPFLSTKVTDSNKKVLPGSTSISDDLSQGETVVTRLTDYIELVLGGFKCIDKLVTEAAVGHAQKQITKVLASFSMNSTRSIEAATQLLETPTAVSISNFKITREESAAYFSDPKYSVNEPLVLLNLRRIMMGLTLDKAIMLEGPPGVGKTSLVQFLAKKVGIKCYRVNLNEQTDMIDLLGADVPSAQGGNIFAWADGVLIQAMKEGAWLLLDELNMATQTVLEGLNSVLDHRGSIYLAELDMTIMKHPGFRIFASQNPMSMGAGRKGLPHSFLTRFTRIWIDQLSPESMKDIVKRVYTDTLQQHPIVAKMVEFFFLVKEVLGNGGKHESHRGESLWEFNLRDLHKMIEIALTYLKSHQNSADDETNTLQAISTGCRLIVMDRIDDNTTKLKVRQIYHHVFSSLQNPNNIAISKLVSQGLYLNSLENLMHGTLEQPSYLNQSNICLKSQLIFEPLRNSIQVALQTPHPILIIHDSQDSGCSLDIYDCISSLKPARGIQTISLFGSSDLIDLIGSYEQINIDQAQRDASAVKLKSLLLSDDTTSETLWSNQPNSAQYADSLSQVLVSCFRTQTPHAAAKKPDGQVQPKSLFCWQESILSQCIRSGKWVVLRGAELVNPAILERLNGMLEDTEIFINEALGSGPETEHLIKHPEFRIFVLFDNAKAKSAPSRALRNRCIELNLSNYSPQFSNPSSEPAKLAPGSKIAMPPLQSQLARGRSALVSLVTAGLCTDDDTVLVLEDVVRCERVHRMLEVLATQYAPFVPRLRIDHFGTQDCLLALVDSAKCVQRAVGHRSNYDFPFSESLTQQKQLFVAASQEESFCAEALLSKDPSSLLKALLSRRLRPRPDLYLAYKNPGPAGNDKTSKAVLGAQYSTVQNLERQLWQVIKRRLLSDNTRDDVEEAVRDVEQGMTDEAKRGVVMLAQGIPQGKFMGKWFLMLVEGVKKQFETNNEITSESHEIQGMLEEHINKRTPVKGLRPEIREIIASSNEAGFASPANLALNIVYNYLLIGSDGFSEVLDKNATNTKQNNSGDDTNAQVWNILCKVLSKSQVAKFQTTTEIGEDAMNLINPLKHLVSKTLDKDGTNTNQSYEALFSLLDFVSTSIDSSYDKLLKTVATQFSVYSILDDDPTMAAPKMLFRPIPANTNALLSLIHRAEHLKNDELCISLPSGIKQNIELSELFERVKELANLTVNLKQQFSNRVSLQKSYLTSQLCKFFKCSSQVEASLDFLWEFGRWKKIKQLAGLVGRMDLKDLRVSEVDMLYKITSDVDKTAREAAQQHKENVEVSAEAYLRKLNLSMHASVVHDADAQMQQEPRLLTLDELLLSLKCDLEVLDHVTKYAENPNLNTFTTLLASLLPVITLDASTSLGATPLEPFVSLLSHVPAFQGIYKHLLSVGATLRGQKMRRLSKSNFCGSGLAFLQGTKSTNEESLPSFLSSTVFGLLLQQGAFVPEADVQEMKRIVEILKEGAKGSFENIDRAISDIYRQFRSFVKNGFFVAFGDFLLPYFGHATKVAFAIREHSKLSIKATTPLLTLSPSAALRAYLLPRLQAASSSGALLASSLPFTLLISTCRRLSLALPLYLLQASSEQSLLQAKSVYVRETQLTQGRTFDEASRLRQLARGIERTVRDEYTDKAEADNRKDREWEVRRIFGVEGIGEGKWEEYRKEMDLKSRRVAFLELVIQGVFLPERKIAGKKQAEIAAESGSVDEFNFGVAFYTEDFKLDFNSDSYYSLSESICKVFHKQLISLTDITGLRDIRKSIMLEENAMHETYDEFCSKWHRQLEQFVEIDKNSFYRGSCVNELIALRPTLFSILERIDVLTKEDDLRDLPAFNTIISIVDYILSMELSRANLNELCLMMEKLMTSILEYESVTPKIWHLTAAKEAIQANLYEYRQKERRGWRAIVFAQCLEVMCDDLEDCIELKEVLKNEILKDKLTDEAEETLRVRNVIDLFDSFFVRSTLIQRLFRQYWMTKVLKSLPLTNPKANHTIIQYLRHMLKYHQTFVYETQNTYNSLFPQIQQPIKENEKLSNWHMKDIVNMKMNVNKYHKGLIRAMKAHKEIMDHRVLEKVYNSMRTLRNKENIDEAQQALLDPEERKRFDELAALAAAEEQQARATQAPSAETPTAAQASSDQALAAGAEGVYANASIPAGGKPEPAGKKEKLPVKQPDKLTSKIVSTILAKCTTSVEQAELLKASLRVFRVCPSTAVWLTALGMPKKEYAYARYHSPFEVTEWSVRDWLSTMKSLKDSNSKAQRFRALDGFMKELFAAGVRERFPLDNWDVIKTFSVCPEPIDVTSVPADSKFEFRKACTRLYEMVDILHTNRTNLAYSPDISPVIRIRMQGYMVHLLGLSMICLKKLSKLVKLQEKITVAITASKELDARKPNEARHTRGSEKLLVAVKQLQKSLGNEISLFEAKTSSLGILASAPQFLSGLSLRFSRLAKMQYLPASIALDTLNPLLAVMTATGVATFCLLIKYCFISCRVMSNVVYKGVCVVKVDGQEEKPEEGEEEWDFGTGIGEGKGEQDKTDDYKFEEQLLGEKGGEEDAEDQGEEQQEEGKDGDDPEERDEEGGKDMENDFEGDNHEEDKDKQDDEKGDEDNEMDEVDQDQIDQDLWGDKNEEREEGESSDEQDPQDRRDVEDKEYEGQQPERNEDTEQAPKEGNDKEQREANDDYKAQEQKEEEDQQKEPEEPEKKGDDEYAEVDSISEMSDRDSNKKMEFDEEENKPEENPDAQPEDDEANEDQLGDDMPSIGDEIDEKLDEEPEDQEHGDSEVLDDPLNKPEREMPPEMDKDDEEGGKQDDTQDQAVKDSGLNPEASKEEQGKKEQQNRDEVKNKEQKNKGQQAGQKDKKKEMQEEPIDKDDHLSKASQESIDGDSQDEEQKDSMKKLDQDKKSKIEDEPQSKPNLKFDQSRLQELVRDLLAQNNLDDHDSPPDQDDGDEIEGLEHGGDEQVRVKKNAGADKIPKEERDQKRTRDNNASDLPEAFDATQTEDPEEQKQQENEAENEQDGGKDLMDEEALDKKNEAGKREEDASQDGEVAAPEKKLKRKDDEEDSEDELTHLNTFSDIQAYLQLLNQDYEHATTSNHSWHSIEPQLRVRAFNLSEELRCIFKPTKVAAMKGDYRTGKRLNMRKVVSYVASNYRKDKIWLRRADPSQRDYEIMLAIDDTLSMSEKNVGYLALEGMITLALALSKMEVGKLGISGIRNGLHEVLGFNSPFIPSSEGQKILDEFTFNFNDALSADLGLPNFLSQVGDKFSAGPHTRMLFILSDGKCNKDLVRPTVRELEDVHQVMVIYIILDRKEDKGSILNLRSTEFVSEDGGPRKVRIKQYLDDFPFKNYVIVQDINELASVMVSILRDYFASMD